MSSVKDRIRNLQQSTNSQPSKSVAERARAVERVSEPDAEQPKSLSQLKKHFDSNVTTETRSGLGARVARFDSDASQSLEDRVRRLESSTSDIGSLSARASAFEVSGSDVREVAGQFSEEQKPPDDTATLRKARAMFEAGNKDKPHETTVSTLKISPEVCEKNVDNGNNSTKISAEKSSEALPSSSTTANRDAVTDGVSRRAAIFERAESEPKWNTRAVPPMKRDLPNPQPSIQPTKIGDVSETSNENSSKGTEEKSMRDELREVKRTNEELVSVLLELTAAFRHLEGTRDELQKRIAELEKK